MWPEFPSCHYCTYPVLALPRFFYRTFLSSLPWHEMPWNDRQGNMGQGNVGMAETSDLGAKELWVLWGLKVLLEDADDFFFLNECLTRGWLKMWNNPKELIEHHMGLNAFPLTVTKRGGNDHLLERYTTVILPKVVQIRHHQHGYILHSSGFIFHPL